MALHENNAHTLFCSLIPEIIFQEIESSPSVVSTYSTYICLCVFCAVFELASCAVLSTQVVRKECQNHFHVAQKHIILDDLSGVLLRHAITIQLSSYCDPWQWIFEWTNQIARPRVLSTYKFVIYQRCSFLWPIVEADYAVWLQQLWCTIPHALLAQCMINHIAICNSPVLLLYSSPTRWFISPFMLT